MNPASSVFLGLTLMASLAGAAHAQTVLKADTEDSYEEQAVAVRRVFPLRRDGTTASSDERPTSSAALWDVFQGRDHHAISDEAFFQIVGREDLITRYHRKMVLRKGLTYAAWPLIVGGLTFATLEYMYRNESDQNLYLGGGTHAPPGVSPGWGLGLAAAGIVSFLVGRFTDPTPVNADEADSLARDYDQSLRRRLGISDSAERNSSRLPY